MAWMDGPSDWGPDLMPVEMDEGYLNGYYGDGYYGDMYDDGYGEYPGEYPEDYPLDDEYGPYDPNDPYYDDDLYYTRISANELLDRCVLPTLSQAVETLLPLLGLCFVSRVTAYFVAETLPGTWIGKFVVHSINAVFGVMAIHWFFKENVVYMLMLSLLTYCLLWVTSCKCRSLSGVTVSFVTVVYLVTCELLVVKDTEWHQIRGAQMILAMKIISLGFDLSAGTVQELPGMVEYAGYTFQVGSVIFGPWISFQDYSHMLSNHKAEKKMIFYWVAKLVKSLSLALLCVIVSSCIVHWLILDYSFIWFLAYRDAQSFRFSHYFVGYLSELTLTTSGLGITKNNGDVRWDITVTKPLHTEVPRSLVEVVTNWHLPMHHWLKTYVFKMAKPLGNFSAILLTYAASSILHGLNFQLAAVLLSLGFYSYVEYMLRSHLSRVFDACIQAKRCKPECEHTFKATNPYVISVNLGFGALTVFHLAYLGLMFDNSASEEQGYDMDHTLGKWSELGYASHWVALATYIFYLLI